MQLKNLLKALLALVIAYPCYATSIIFPTYSTPILEHGRLVTLSPDRLRVLGISPSGHIEWKTKLSSEGSLFHHKSGDLVLCKGASISILNPERGTIQPLFDAPSGVVRMGYQEESDIFLGFSEWDKAELWFFDGDTHLLKRKERFAESVPYSDREIVVVAKAKRKKVSSGYTFTKSWIEVFDRATWKRLWTTSFTQRKDPFHQMCRVGAFLVWEDGSDLAAARISGGKVYRARAAKPVDAIGPSGLRADGDALVYLASELNHRDFNRSKQSIYKVTLPEFKVVETRAVKVIEAASVEKAGEYLISDALYRTACFRHDGTKVWEHFQMHRTKVIDGRIYFSDYNNGLARLCCIDVATGVERVLLSEKVDESKSTP